MHCDVYKFPKNEGWYVYIARPDYPNDTENLKDWLGVLPAAMRTKLGFGQFIMHLDLSSRQKLAHRTFIKLKPDLTNKAIMCKHRHRRCWQLKRLSKPKMLRINNLINFNHLIFYQILNITNFNNIFMLE